MTHAHYPVGLCGLFEMAWLVLLFTGPASRSVMGPHGTMSMRGRFVGGWGGMWVEVGVCVCWWMVGGGGGGECGWEWGRGKAGG